MALLVLSVTLAACDQQAPPANTAADSPPPALTKWTGPRVAGRYTIIHSPQVENDTMLLDTVTGRTWRLEVDPKTKEVLWVEITGQDS